MELYTWDEMEKEVLSGTIARKIVSGDKAMVAQALPAANRAGSDQESAGESACPTFFHELSRAAGPSQQSLRTLLPQSYTGTDKTAMDFRRLLPEIHGSLVCPGSPGISRILIGRMHSAPSARRR